MKIVLFLSIFVFFVQALTLEESKHFLNRTSFGYTQNDLKYFQLLSKKEAVEYIIRQAQEEILIPDTIYKRLYSQTESIDKKKRRLFHNENIDFMKRWWYRMMLDSRYAFREKMTLFWHNHFVSEYRIVKNSVFMFEQNMLYRREALGSFATLLHKSSKDLAMLIYLDSNLNTKKNPNENYARELLELFSMGEGYYTENDIREAARAFTGWRVNKNRGKFKKVSKLHDDGMKTFLNQEGKFDGEAIIDIVLTQDRTAYFIVSKLYQEFIRNKINSSLVTKLSENFKNNGYDIAFVMRELLMSKDFWETSEKKVKSPTELMVSLIKNFDLEFQKELYMIMMKCSEKLGQTLFNPPNVQGWLGGENWLDTDSILKREYCIKKIIRRFVKQDHIRTLELKTYNDIHNYFYPIVSNQTMKVKPTKKFYIKLLTQPLFQLK